MEKGIICFETGEFAKYRTENQFYALPLLQFLESTMDIKYIYRQIATFEELRYYMKIIGAKHFQNDFGVVYFSFHGCPGSIALKGTGNISLDMLAEESAGNESLLGRHVHFSSCETLKCDEEDIMYFKRNVGAKTVSGYTKEVDATQAYINEILYFNQIFRYSTVQTIKKHMENLQSEINKLGFQIY
jgi:hypothetical protein